jgi:hypothetical protein
LPSTPPPPPALTPDWGGVVVMAQHELSGPAPEVLFSVDYGRCWRKVPLENAITVENIRWVGWGALAFALRRRGPGA